MGKGGGSGGEAGAAPKRKITIEELAEHRTPEDAWMASRGKVDDVSNWHDHPGGSVIFTHAGELHRPVTLMPFKISILHF